MAILKLIFLFQIIIFFFMKIMFVEKMEITFFFKKNVFQESIAFVTSHLFQ